MEKRPKSQPPKAKAMLAAVAEPPEQPEPSTSRPTTKIKSILKAKAHLTESSSKIDKSKTSTSSLKGSKKRVEISTLPPRTESANTEEERERERPVSRRPAASRDRDVRETPLPRVAYLAPQPSALSATPKSSKASKAKLKKSSKTPKTRSKANSKVFERLASPKRSASASLPKCVVALSQAAKPNPRPKTKTKPLIGPVKIKSRSGKKKKGKNKPGSSTSEDNKYPGVRTGQEQYIQELNAINDLLRSVTVSDNPNAPRNGLEANTMGFSRPFSAEELSKLVSSVGRVAAIHHEHIPGTSDVADGVIREMLAKNLTGGAGANADTKKLEVLHVHSDQDDDDESPKKKKVKGKKSKKSLTKVKSKISKSKTLRTDENGKIKLSDFLEASTSTKFRLGRSTKIVNRSSVKSLYRSAKTRKPKFGSRSSSLSGRRNSDSNLSQLSELDLVKSAMLNKRFYEESLALEQKSSSEISGKSSFYLYNQLEPQPIQPNEPVVPYVYPVENDRVPRSASGSEKSVKPVAIGSVKPVAIGNINASKGSTSIIVAGRTRKVQLQAPAQSKKAETDPSKLARLDWMKAKLAKKARDWDHWDEKRLEKERQKAATKALYQELLMSEQRMKDEVEKEKERMELNWRVHGTAASAEQNGHGTSDTEKGDAASTSKSKPKEPDYIGVPQVPHWKETFQHAVRKRQEEKRKEKAGT